jgi:hypothetical protein
MADSETIEATLCGLSRRSALCAHVELLGERDGRRNSPELVRPTDRIAVKRDDDTVHWVVIFKNGDGDRPSRDDRFGKSNFVTCLSTIRLYLGATPTAALSWRDSWLS